MTPLRLARLSVSLLLLGAGGMSIAHAQSAAPAAEPAAPAADAPQPKTPIPKTALPPRDTPRAAENGRRPAAPDPDWPCVQPKITSLSYGQMWGGPPLDDALKNWRGDEAREDLVEKLAARRTSPEEVKTAIDAYAKAAGPKKDESLTLLFAGVFDELNEQRSRIIDGIQRYARKQRALSDRIKDESLKMAATQQDMASQMTPEAQKSQEALDWDTRIYDERAQSLTYVCETPVILEQRAFDIGREIQSRLN